MFLLFVLNLIAFLAWMVNIWVQTEPMWQFIAVILALYHGYVFTDFFGKWAAERRNNQL